MNNWIILALLAMSPISECRGAIPFGISVGLNPVLVFILSIVSNILVIPAILVLLRISKIREIVYKFLGKTIERKVEEWRKKFGKYEEIGLMLFVAIPLPVTGAYTGSLIAYFLELDTKKSTIYISLGVIIAALIMTLISVGVINFIR